MYRQLRAVFGRGQMAASCVNEPGSIAPFRDH